MNIMRIITCASYYGTGSSAVMDMLAEFETDVQSLGEYEYRLIQDPDGISDLEYNIVENNHRHNSSYAIKRFKKFISSLTGFGYAEGYKIFGNALTDLTNEYINGITELEVFNWWHRDRLDKGRLYSYVDRIYSLMHRLSDLKSEKRYSMLKNREKAYYTDISEHEFLIRTRRYLDQLFAVANRKNKPFMMVDQLVPPTNIGRYTRYFNDIRVIVVDRDPRDLYLLEKYVWGWGIIPTDSVEDFVKWFKITRNPRYQVTDDQNVLRVRFEDMVYKYDETRERIIEFVGIPIESKANKRTLFNPEVSVKNTNLSVRYPEEETNIKYIEKELNGYLYEYYNL